ncbi:MAG: hypothetical protein ACLRZH_17980 [Ruthenibacterium lactatiformans]
MVNLLAVMWIGSGMGLPIADFTVAHCWQARQDLWCCCFVLASVQMALCHRGRHGRGLHRRMRPAGAAVRPFPLSGRAWTLLGVLPPPSALMCLFVFLVSRVKQRLRRSQRAKHAAGLSATLS